jgi:hypothetical protein
MGPPGPVTGFPLPFTSYSNIIQRGMFRLRIVPVLSGVVVTFLSSTVVLTPNGQLLDSATIAFSERYVSALFHVIFMLLLYPVFIKVALLLWCLISDG